MGKRGSGGGGGSGTVSNAKELKLFMKNRMWREHWYVIVAVLVIVVALFGSALLQFRFSSDHMYRIDSNDPQLLQRVFHSGDPWVVLCSKPDDIMPEIYGKITQRLRGKSAVGVMDCSQKLPSGKTVYKRFDLNKSIHPTIFTVANGEKPKQIYANYLQSAKALATQVVQQTRKSAKQVMKSSQFHANCLRKTTCVVILQGQKFSSYEKQWMQRVMQQFRTVHFVVVDSRKFRLSLEREEKNNDKKKSKHTLPALAKFRSGEHRLIVFKSKKVTSAESSSPQDKKRSKPSGNQRELSAQVYEERVFDRMPVESFLTQTLRSKKLEPLDEMPSLERRGSSRTPRRARKTRRSTQTQDEEEQSHAEDQEQVQEVQEEQEGVDAFDAQERELEEDQSNQNEDEEEEEVLDLDNEEEEVINLDD